MTSSAILTVTVKADDVFTRTTSISCRTRACEILAFVIITSPSISTRPMLDTVVLICKYKFRSSHKHFALFAVRKTCLKCIESYLYCSICHPNHLCRYIAMVRNTDRSNNRGVEYIDCKTPQSNQGNTYKVSMQRLKNVLNGRD